MIREDQSMRFSSVLIAAATVLTLGTAQAQQPAIYGESITVEQARKAADAAMAEAKKNNWLLAISVVNTSGDLVFYQKMDNTQLGSVGISQKKARTAAIYKRPTKAFEERVAAGGAGLVLLTLGEVVASEGGIPIVIGGKIVGAIGCSGATSAQDGQACQAGVDALK
jgi:glc operon protein GlcG